MATVRVPKELGPEITVSVGPAPVTTTTYKVAADGSVSVADDDAESFIRYVPGAASADAAKSAPAAPAS